MKTTKITLPAFAPADARSAVLAEIQAVTTVIEAYRAFGLTPPDTEYQRLACLDRALSYLQK